MTGSSEKLSNHSSMINIRTPGLSSNVNKMVQRACHVTILEDSVNSKMVVAPPVATNTTHYLAKDILSGVTITCMHASECHLIISFTMQR